MDLEEIEIKITQLLGLSVRAALGGPKLFSQTCISHSCFKRYTAKFWKDLCDKTELLSGLLLTVAVYLSIMLCLRLVECWINIYFSLPLSKKAAAKFVYWFSWTMNIYYSIIIFLLLNFLLNGCRPPCLNLPGSQTAESGLHQKPISVQSSPVAHAMSSPLGSTRDRLPRKRTVKYQIDKIGSGEGGGRWSVFALCSLISPHSH